MPHSARMGHQQHQASEPGQHLEKNRRNGQERRERASADSVTRQQRDRLDRRGFDGRTSDRRSFERRGSERRAGTATLFLADTLNQLHDARADLARQEKLAALGSLVPGMAHEINTPLGTCVTAISHLQSELRHWHAWNRTGALCASRVTSVLHELEQVVRILDINVRRSAELVRSFKQVAVDQAAGQRRMFDLAQYLDEIVLSLKPRLRDAACLVSMDCPHGIMMNSMPGALSQVMTNLVMNALLHGFGGRKGGAISIHGEEDEGCVILRVSDNGIGMNAADLGRMFDPYFTTKRGSGGTGLGAHIVLSQVTEVLRGTIQVSSMPGAGLHVQMRLPRTLECNG